MKYEIIEWNPETRFPARQGDLDFMCSIYAAVNALQLVGDIKELDQSAISFRLAILFMAAAREWDLGRSITEGVDPEHLKELFQRLCWKDIHSETERTKNFSHSDLVKLLTPVNGLKRAAVLSLVGSGTHVHHYVAADLGGDKVLRLHDSQYPSQIDVHGTKLSYGVEEEPEEVGIRHAWIFTQQSR